MQDTQQESERIEGKLPCDECGSSDAVSLYDDGHTFCFSCDHYEPGEEETKTKNSNSSSHKSKGLLSGSFVDIPARHITKDTCRKWGVEMVTTEDGKKALAFPYYNVKGKKVAQKLRFVDKDFAFIGETKKPRLFGQQMWQGGKKVVITEGEMDALSVSQIQNHKWAVMSVPTGAKAASKVLTEHRAWLEESFEEIILMFDMDEPGQEASIECAKIFQPGKCKIASLPCKDANECLIEGKSQDIIQAMWNAKSYRPDGIVTISDVIPKIGLKPEMGLDLPWSQLTELTYGLKLPAVWVWTSGSGMGKTEFFKDMVATNVKNNVKSGVIFLEEETQDTVVDLAGKLVGKCFNSPTVSYNEKERNDAIKALEDSNCVFMYDHFGHDDYDAIRSVIRHMVIGHGCKVIFLDHITAFTDGMGNEANALAEKMMKELSAMTRELKFNLQVISHVRKSDSSRKPAEEGGRVKIDDLKGSGAVKQWSNFVIALERNQQATSKEESRTTTVRILKARGVGKNVGRTMKVIYKPETATLVQANEDFPDAEDLPF